jgi:uncharacterized glyoxalase superfamily protein PhnB
MSPSKKKPRPKRRAKTASKAKRPAAKRPAAKKQTSPGLQRLTPVLIVDAVEPGIRFWVERLGFKAENEVPGPDGRLQFASATDGRLEVMYQTKASVLAEDHSMGADLSGHSVALFIAVSDLDAIEKAMAGAPVVKPRHKTFYGSTELYVREPGGNVVGFAQFG